jgi:hypothetical protein
MALVNSALIGSCPSFKASLCDQLDIIWRKRQADVTELQDHRLGRFLRADVTFQASVEWIAGKRFL